MGLFDDVFSTFDSAVSGLFGTAGSYLGGSGGASGDNTSFLPVNFAPYQAQNFPNPVTYAQPVMASVPAMTTAGVAIAARFAQRFPNLAVALQTLTMRFGFKFTPDKLWRMVKGSGGMVAALIGAEAINELFVWKSTHKSRRMNPANTKALRRSLRRLKSFDRLSSRVSSQLSRAGGSRRRGRRSSCSTCRKSPCMC